MKLGEFVEPKSAAKVFDNEQFVKIHHTINVLANQPTGNAGFISFC